MKIAYFTYWGINEGLSQSTSIKNLVSLNSFNNIQKIHYYTFEIKKIKHDFILPEKVIHFQINRRIGSNIIDNELPYFLVPKDTIFGSTVLNKNSYSLVSCVVSPGFDFKDFELFSEEQLLVDFPDHQDIIKKLT